MPMIWRGDHDGIDVLVSQKFAVIEVGFYIGVLTAVHTLFTVRGVDVRDRNHFDALDGHYGVDEITAARAQADATDAYGFVGRFCRDQGRRKGRSGGNSCCGFPGALEELSTGDAGLSIHVDRAKNVVAASLQQGRSSQSRRCKRLA